MSARAPVTPAQARARAQTRLERSLTTWATTDARDAVFALPLHPPGERDVLADRAAARTWIESWDGVDGVVRTPRAWRSVGTNAVPERIELVGADAIARFAGGASARVYRTLASATRVLAAGLGDDPPLRDAIRSVGRAIAALDGADLDRVVASVRWLRQNPDSGYRPRQVPVRGIDSKWIEGHRAVVTALVAASGPTTLGLVEADTRLRLRVLDPSLRIAGIDDLTVPMTEAVNLALQPQRVLVVENLTTLLSLPALHGTVAIHGDGYGAGARVTRLPWVPHGSLVYWGDLDSHGLAILDELRAWVPDARSILMDRETLLAHRDLCGHEPKPSRAAMPRLTEAERAALALLRGDGDLRLEQERVFWPTALAVLESIAARA